jgi:hydrogenase nickel incorporation protein HypB
MNQRTLLMESATGQPEADRQVARENRERLGRAGVVAVNLVGGLGCGKTSLVEATVRRLAPDRRVGVMTADPYPSNGAGRIPGLAGNVVRAEPGFGLPLAARHVRSALARLDLGAIDLLLVENVGSLAGPDAIDLGEDARVAMFSVAAGHHKPAKYPDVVRWADAVVLNKADLLQGGAFDVRAFRAAVGRLNPAAEYVEMSMLTGHGVDAWVDWLLTRPQPARHAH